MATKPIKQDTEKTSWFSFSNLKIWHRLAIGFGLLMALLVIEMIATDVLATRIEHEVEDIVSHNFKKIELLETMSESVHIVSRVAHPAACGCRGAASASEWAAPASWRCRLPWCSRRASPALQRSPNGYRATAVVSFLHHGAGTVRVIPRCGRAVPPMPF